MSVTIQKIGPTEIEAESFRIIESEIGEHGLDPQTWAITRRVIHATADFAFRDNLKFHPQAIERGIAAIRAGKNILTDVNMTAIGISKGLLGHFGGTVSCGVADPAIAIRAKELGKTRSQTAISEGLNEDVGIIAIGNAPTALLQIMKILKERPELNPLIIGVPVGFVNAAESKALLAESPHLYITSLGRKGGSPVAASITNALLHLAKEL
ncbi:precorrin-8X methylmutase [Desulfotalea psychrophila]|uniref:Probable precorrin-8X methylmutase (CobH) n=1 Tax=Desulfotalea psychrophila (strain LSv54 / DSM 12343) TaxID=177439 RepID=Q6ARS7_DESPS|nr:precorrin-8X methylmutase [Desulfotalea psychrophila]CAG34948.1 probable precorrin-8X methylmutase (CobH) [Desulfotalea psychrophila LSv54]